jgi:broad specificity phosphatase PhoE
MRRMFKEPAQVLLARHGQTEWNLIGRRQGQLDSPLTPAGIQYARRTAEVCAMASVDAIFTSPIGRARATAEICAQRLGLQATVVDDLAEIHHGDMAGMTDDEIEEAFPGELRRRADNLLTWTFPGGESYSDGHTRAGRALETITASDATRPLIVSHEMVGRMLRAQLTGTEPSVALAWNHPHGVVLRIDREAGAVDTIETEASSL